MVDMKEYDVNVIKTLREMMKEIDEKETHTKEDATIRKAIFRSISVIGAYKNDLIIDKKDIEKLLKKIRHEITTETGLYATDRPDLLDSEFKEKYCWELDHCELGNEIDELLKEE
jgi:hypothetical protein